MASNDIEIVQSFIRKYINKAVKEHFKDQIGEDETSLSKATPRSAIKLVCLHKDTDPITLTGIRLLIWWVEARGLLDEFIYGIPYSQFHETVQFLPQIKLFWREKTETAKVNDRYPIRARYTIRYKGDVSTKASVKALATKINNIFNKPVIHSFEKGRKKYSYRDKEKGYEFIITASSNIEAKSVINSLLEIQDDNPLKEDCLTESVVEKTWLTTETVTVNGEIHRKPKQRPIGKVWFTHAELSVHGIAKDITLVDNKRPVISTYLD